MPTKILVVDDSATMRRVLQMTFAGEDAQVVAVDGGEAGVAKAGELTPDVVFADASMQGVDGYEVARRIKANPSLARTAVIVMASQHNPYDDGKGRSAGVDDHISKPFDTQGVIDRVAQVLARPRNVSSSGTEAVRPAAPTAQITAQPRPAAPAAAAAPQVTQATAPGRAATHGTRMGIGGPVPVAPQAAAPAAPAPRPAAPVLAPAAPVMRPAATAPMSPLQPVAAPIGAPKAPAPVAATNKPAAAIQAATSDLGGKLTGLGLSKEQVEGVLSLSRELIEQVVWEVVPDLAEQLIKEEIKRLTVE